MTGIEFIKTEAFQKILKEFGLKIEDFTCNGCGCKDECKYSFDPYSVNGECLAGK